MSFNAIVIEVGVGAVCGDDIRFFDSSFTLDYDELASTLCSSTPGILLCNPELTLGDGEVAAISEEREVEFHVSKDGKNGVIFQDVDSDIRITEDTGDHRYAVLRTLFAEPIEAMLAE